MSAALGGPNGSPGFFGKLPSHGDFVSRHLPRSFTDPWDSWLQSVIANSRAQLAETWLDIYLTSPIWRFALSSGLCGDTPWTGLVMPSVDRVGRYFPLTMAVALEGRSNLMRLLSDAETWYTRAEELVLSSLDDGFDIDDFDQSVRAMAQPPTAPGPDELVRFSTSHPAWQFGLSAVDGSEGNMACIAQTLLKHQFKAYSLWWTQGSERIDPSLLISEGLPPVSGFSGLLDGDWNKWGWGRFALPLAAPSAKVTENMEN
ncbi:MAG: type VI secretion system-associated protein TagF [Gammaproteobacteria bacterium]|nr:type VI secretion system-associated protein TagF [Gammaproteobacteria bacterium]